jgi:tRNA-uridine 2-sulfurtransferase
VIFTTPQYAITPGQVVTVYEGEMVLGGGWIDAAIDEPLEDSASQEQPSLMTN